jgi:hypothetical protein
MSAHGLIHLMGFLKEWKLSEIKELSGKTIIPLSENLSKFIGAFWLIVCLLFLASGTAYLFKKEWWWMIAVIGIILSQALIILYWQDAKFGTIANIIILFACILSFGTWSFNTSVKIELQSFLPVVNKDKKIIATEMISSLPPVVQKWIKHSNIIGREIIQTVHLEQRGKMRSAPGSKWMPVNAEQYFTIEKPGFFWTVDVEAAPFTHLYGRDKYENGRGHMLIKLLSLYTVVDSKGKETDQGSMLRYLAEIVWFPSAALGSFISWEQIDSLKARATITFGGITASGIFSFNQDGDMVSFEALRYYDRKEGAALEDWLILNDKDGYKEFEGIRVPAKSTVTWKLKSGDFTWFKLEIMDIKYN